VQDLTSAGDTFPTGQEIFYFFASENSTPFSKELATDHKG
jgi:hypothetical protein